MQRADELRGSCGDGTKSAGKSGISRRGLSEIEGEDGIKEGSMSVGMESYYEEGKGASTGGEASAGPQQWLRT